MSDIAPSLCPNCSSPAYVGLYVVECVNPECRSYCPTTSRSYDAEVYDGQEEEGLSLSDYLFENDKTPTTLSTAWTFPVPQQPDHWKSTLTALPATRTWSVDPLWIHQCYVGDFFVDHDTGVLYRVGSIDRFASPPEITGVNP